MIITKNEFITYKNCGASNIFTAWDHKPGNGHPVRLLAAGEVVPVRCIGHENIFNQCKQEYNAKWLKYLLIDREPENDCYWFCTPDDGNFYYDDLTRTVYISVAESKADVDFANLRKTFSDIKDYINCNIRYGNTKHIILTYADEFVSYNEKGIQDEKQLSEDFKKFWKRLIRFHEKNELIKPEYINIIEPQARKVWHCHLLLFYPDKNSNPFISNDDIAKLWGLGFTKTKNLNNDQCDNFGNYFSGYFKDIPLDELPKRERHKFKDKVEWKKELETGKSKAIVKGGRLWMYPAGMNLWRHSQGIKKPLVREVTRGDLNFLTRNSKKKFEIDGEIINNFGEVVNTYHREEYINRAALFTPLE